MARLSVVTLLLLALGATACVSGSAPGLRGAVRTKPAPGTVVHVLRKGETIYRLAKYYRVPPTNIIRANRIRDVSDVPIGTRLAIPGASFGQPAKALTLAAVSAVPPRTPAPPSTRQRETDLNFRWPVDGRLSSNFGWRDGRAHEGIDIAARSGTKIRASEAGRVTHSGWLSGYGRVVIVKHSGRYSTVYAHNRKNVVKKGQFVEKGQIVAEVGASGRATGPHVHFEVRRDRKPQDPMRYLP